MKKDNLAKLRIQKKGIIYLYSVIVLLPATVMSIAFLKDGQMPPVTPIILFLIGVSAIGYKIEYHISPYNQPALKVTSIWRIKIKTKSIQKHNINGIGIGSYKLEDTKTEKNHFSGKYETTSLGTYSTYHYPFLKINNQKYGLVGLGKDDALKNNVVSLAKSLKIKFLR